MASKTMSGVRFSTNLARWAAVTNFIANTQAAQVVDFTAGNSPARSYCAVS